MMKFVGAVLHAVTVSTMVYGGVGLWRQSGPVLLLAVGWFSWVLGVCVYGTLVVMDLHRRR